MSGHDPVHQRDDGTEEDYDLNAMLKNMKTELEKILGADWVYEIDLDHMRDPISLEAILRC